MSRDRRRRKRRRYSRLRPVLFGVIVLLSTLVASELLRRPDGRDWSRVIAYIPLDDRTDNLEDVLYAAEASGWEIVTPPRDWFRTALDGQPRNDNGAPYGNREALFEWARDMGRAGCHYFIFSLDQLFSGGLANSRAVRETWPLRFSKNTMDEIDAFTKYVLPLAKNKKNKLYLFDSLARLSPTVGYQGISERQYYALREYGMVPRPILADRDLTLERVFSLYPYAEDGKTLAENALSNDRFRDALSKNLLESYLGVRRRKLSLTDAVLNAIDPYDNIQLFIGVDDSSNRDNIQYNELRYLRSRIGSDVSSGMATMAGLDSLARMFVGRIAQEAHDYHVRASVRYVGGSEEKHSSEFDLYTLEDVVKLHLDFFRAVEVPEAQAELQFLVMTAPDDPARKAEYVEELAAALESNLARHIPTVLNEASNDAYGDALEEALLKRIPFASLVAYAGKYDQANVTGAAFAMGFSRYLYLRCDAANAVGRDANTARTDAANAVGRDANTARTDAADADFTDPDTAHVKQMANSMALTEYILHTRAPLNAYLQSLGADTGNIPRNAPYRNDMQRKLQELFDPECAKVCENLNGTELLCGVWPWRTRKVKEVSISDYVFPWSRTFELSFAVEATLED